MSSQILTGKEAQEAILKGMKKVADTVAVTFGPNGGNVSVQSSAQNDADITKDGRNVGAKVFPLPDEVTGVKIIKDAAQSANLAAHDGSTNTTILTMAFTEAEIKHKPNGLSGINFHRRVASLAEKVMEVIKENSVDVDDRTLKSVALVASNGDHVIADSVSAAFSHVGKDGVIMLERAVDLGIKVDVREGVMIEKGMALRGFATDRNRFRTDFSEPFILVTDNSIGSIHQIMPYLHFPAKEGKPLVVFCNGTGNDVAETLASAAMNGVKVCLVNVEGGEFAMETLADIADCTGATLISAASGKRFAVQEDLATARKHLGVCQRAFIEKGKTTLSGCPEAKVQMCLKKLTEMDESTDDETSKRQIDFRKRAVSGKYAVLKIGVSSINEQEFMDLVDDTRGTCKGALEEGVIPGSGNMLAWAAVKVAWPASTPEERVIMDACIQPFRQLVMNQNPQSAKPKKFMLIGRKASGLDRFISGAIDTMKDSKTPWMGYNVPSEKWCDLLDHGVVDASKVIRIGLENAVKAAGLAASIDRIVLNP